MVRLLRPLRHGVLGGERSPSISPHSGRCPYHPDLVNRPPKPHRSPHPQALQGGPTWFVPQAWPAGRPAPSPAEPPSHHGQGS